LVEGFGQDSAVEVEEGAAACGVFIFLLPFFVDAFSLFAA
jgi:hypothetical protein